MMGCLAHSGGHNAIVQGANSNWGKEHAVVRDFLATVDKYVRAAGWDTVNCTDDIGRTKPDVWGNSARKHLQVKHSNLDLQYHLNATPGGTGCEVLYKPGYGNKEKAAQLSAAIAKALGVRDRGAKERKDLGWLNTTKTGLMVEICFVDNKSDMDNLYANWDATARAIAAVVIGKSISTTQSGWVQSGNDWSYYQNGHKTYGWLQDIDNWFYFNDNGVMVTGWYQFKEEWFYFNPISDGTRGRMITGWLQDGGNWFYLNPVSDGTKGRMLVDWQKVNEKWYYFNPVSDGTRGMMITGTKVIDGKEYTFRDDGSLVE